MKNSIKLSALYFVPFLGFAAPAPSNFSELIDLFIRLISLSLPIIISLAILFFLWGLARFISNAGGGKEKEEAKNVMVWGIIGLFIMLSLWGIIRVLQATFIL